MIICIDADGTLLDDRRRYDDVTTPLRLLPGARSALAALKRAGHVLVLWSSRNRPSVQYLAEFDPLVRAGVITEYQTDASRELHAERWRQLVDFVAAELPGIFDAIDDGRNGKVHADIYIDDMAIRFGGPGGASWPEIAQMFGE